MKNSENDFYESTTQDLERLFEQGLNEQMENLAQVISAAIKGVRPDIDEMIVYNTYLEYLTEVGSIDAIETHQLAQKVSLIAAASEGSH